MPDLADRDIDGAAEQVEDVLTINSSNSRRRTDSVARRLTHVAVALDRGPQPRGDLNDMDTLVPRARDLAERFLAPMAQRWKHVQAAAERAAELAAGLPSDQRDTVVAAAWLHDIGHAPELERTGFAPIDGALHLREQGWPSTVVDLVAHHSGARFEAYARGVADEHAEFGFEDTPLGDLLAAADLTSGPGGERYTFDDLLAEIRERHPEPSEVPVAWQVAEPLMREALTRAENNLRWATGEITTDDATTARKSMVETLEASPDLADPSVLAAFATVPRHMFVPTGTPLSDAYDIDQAIMTRHDLTGMPISSVSAPWLQAQMAHAAHLRPGDRVLEIGSGGYNAALLAEIVGEQGTVVTVDVDPWVTARAQRFLEATGYGDRVEVITADAELPLPGQHVFDAIIVTVGAWDIPPAWTDQLAPAGHLVVPLGMGLTTRSLSFRRQDDHLVATSSQVCGFVPMQGIGAHVRHQLHLTDPAGIPVTFTSDSVMPLNPDDLGQMLSGESIEAWSGVSIGPGQVDLSGMLLWMASHESEWCGAMSPAGGAIHPDKVLTLWPNALVTFDAFVTLTMRNLSSSSSLSTAEDGFELGARGFGPEGSKVAARVSALLRAWDQAGRPREPEIRYFPRGTRPADPVEDSLLLKKQHGHVALTWTAHE